MADDRDRSPLRCLVTLSEIAALFVGGKKSAVSNWRTRYRDFPAPVAPGRSPLFDVEDVIDWLDISSVGHDTVGARPAEEWWWVKTAAAFRSEHGDELGRPLLAALVLVHAALMGEVPTFDHDADVDWGELVVGADIAVLRSTAFELEERSAALRGLLTDPIEASADVDAAEVAQLLRRLDEAAISGTSGPKLLEGALRDAAPTGTAGGVTTTLPDLARLMAGLGAPPRGARILDPACGEGSTLVQCVRAAGRAAETDGAADDTVIDPRLRVFGQEYDPTAWRIARTAVLLEGVVPRLGDPLSDTLVDDHWPDLDDADLVVLDTPVRVTTGSGESRRGENFDHAPVEWVWYVRKHLAPSGRAVVALPAHEIVNVPSVRRKPAERLRQELETLSQRGHVEAVVVLPRRVRLDVVGPLTLWVLRGDGASDTRTLLIETDKVQLPTRASAKGGLPFDVENMIELLERWRSGKRGVMKLGSVKAEAHESSRLFPVLVAATERAEPSDRGSLSTALKADTADDRIEDLEKERRELLRHAMALVDALESEIESLWETDGSRYWQIRSHIDAIRDVRR